MSVTGVNSNNNAVQTNDSQSTSNTSADSSLQSIESTFLTLLVQELQNQDPTAPMDSTQMVGQMIASYSFAANAAVMKYGTVRTPRRRTPARSQPRCATRTEQPDLPLSDRGVRDNDVIDSNTV